jgi:hypothetical protein
MARRTLADIHWKEGFVAEQKRILLMQLRLRFKSVPKEAADIIQSTTDADKLAEWLHQFAIAPDLASIGILPAD